MTLNITLEKEFPNSQVEPVMIRLGPDEPVLWMKLIVSRANYRPVQDLLYKLV